MKKIKKKPPKIFETPKGERVIYEEQNTNPPEWIRKKYLKPIELTEQEMSKAQALGYNIENLLEIKRGLIEKKRPVDIEAETGISRSTIYKYKKILSEKDIEKAIKDRENTENSQNVFSIWLIPMVLSAENTFPYHWGILPLFLIAIYVWLSNEWAKQKRLRQEHKYKNKELRNLFDEVFDLSYEQYAIVLNSKKEVDHYKNILTKFNNSGRMVHYIERGLEQDNSQHFEEKEAFARAYEKSNKFRIEQGEKRSVLEWQKLEQMGLLDYFYYSRKALPTFETSKKYLFSSVEWYAKNKAMPIQDKSRRKELETKIPDHLKKYIYEPTN